MLQKEIQTFFPIPILYTIGDFAIKVDVWTFEDYLFFLNTFQHGKTPEEIRIFLREIYISKGGEDPEDFEKFLWGLEDKTVWDLGFLLLNDFEQEEAKESKKAKQSGQTVSIMRQMVFVMMRMNLSETEILAMPYKRFFMYTDALGYWMREETEEGRKENRANDSILRTKDGKVDKMAYYESRKKFLSLKK